MKEQLKQILEELEMIKNECELDARYDNRLNGVCLALEGLLIKPIFEFDTVLGEPDKAVAVPIGRLQLCDNQIVRLIFTPQGLRAIAPISSDGLYAECEAGLGNLPERKVIDNLQNLKR